MFEWRHRATLLKAQSLTQFVWFAGRWPGHRALSEFRRDSSQDCDILRLLYNFDWTIKAQSLLTQFVWLAGRWPGRRALSEFRRDSSQDCDTDGCTVNPMCRPLQKNLGRLWLAYTELQVDFICCNWILDSGHFTQLELVRMWDGYGNNSYPVWWWADITREWPTFFDQTPKFWKK